MSLFHNMHGLCYPPPEATHEEVIADPALFQWTLDRLLHHLGVKLKIPKVAGAEVDLHLLYKEVTNLGGLDLVVARKQWVLVCEPFHFPASFTNKSYVIKKLYVTALHHYEQLYFHGRQGPVVPSTADGTHVVPTVDKHAPHTPKRKAETTPDLKRAQSVSIVPCGGEPGSPTVATDLQAGTSFTGTIDGSTEDGYSITLDLLGQRLQAMLYHNTTPDMRSGSPQAVHRQPRDSTYTSPRPDMVKSPRLAASPVNPPRPARQPFQFFELGVNKEQVLHLHSVDGSPASTEQLPQLILELWQQMTLEQRQPFLDMATKDKERYSREYHDYQQRMRASPVPHMHAHVVHPTRLHRSSAASSLEGASRRLPFEAPGSPMHGQHAQQWEPAQRLNHPQHQVHSSMLQARGAGGPCSPGSYMLPPDPHALPMTFGGTARTSAGGSAAHTVAAAHSSATEQHYLSALVIDDQSDALSLAMDMLGDSDNDALIDLFGCSTHIHVLHTSAPAVKPEPKHNGAAGPVAVNDEPTCDKAD